VALPLDDLKEAMPSFFRLPKGEDMTTSRSDLLQGTLELLVLKTLTLEPMHGWGLAQRIQLMSEDVFQVNQGSLYPALQRMKRKGWVRSAWRVTENGRRARYYELTTLGRRQLETEQREWERSSGAVNRILRFVLQGG
jgi:transcriptional regulator